MRQVNNRKYEVTAGDLFLIGSEVEKILKAIQEHEYGFYNAEQLETESKIALKIVEGMDDWQRQHNKGIRLRGDTHIKIEIYDLRELQKRMEEFMKIDLYPSD